MEVQHVAVHAPGGDLDVAYPAALGPDRQHAEPGAAQLGPGHVEGHGPTGRGGDLPQRARVVGDALPVGLGPAAQEGVGREGVGDVHGRPPAAIGPLRLAADGFAFQDGPGVAARHGHGQRVGALDREDAGEAGQGAREGCEADALHDVLGGAHGELRRVDQAGPAGLQQGARLDAVVRGAVVDDHARSLPFRHDDGRAGGEAALRRRGRPGRRPRCARPRPPGRGRAGASRSSRPRGGRRPRRRPRRPRRSG